MKPLMNLTKPKWLIWGRGKGRSFFPSASSYIYQYVKRLSLFLPLCSALLPAFALAEKTELIAADLLPSTELLEFIAEFDELDDEAFNLVVSRGIIDAEVENKHLAEPKEKPPVRIHLQTEGDSDDAQK